MKNMKTGEITPPLPHDEYTKEADRLRAEEAKKKDAAKAHAKPSPAKPVTPPAAQK